MRHLLRAHVVIAFAMSILAAALCAQSPSAGGVAGRVVDSDGSAIPGVTVTARSEALIGGSAAAESDRLGAYRFDALPVGTYSLEARQEGLRPVVREGLEVHAQRVVAVDFVLEPATVEAAITVTGAAPRVSVVDSRIATTFGDEFVDRQPLRRNFFLLLAAAPGVNPPNAGPLAYGGTTQSQNAVVVDGVGATSPADGGQWLQPSLQFFEEIQIGGPGANAELGGFTGGAITAVTRSGGEETRGRVELHYAAPSWVASNDPERVDDEFRHLDYAARLGGRIVPERLWYFLAGERVDLVTTPFGAQGTVERDVPRYLGKLTLQAGPASRVTLLAEIDAIDSERLFLDRTVLPEASSRQEWRTLAGSASWDWVRGPRSFLILRLSGYDGRNDYLPYHGVDLPGRIDVGTGLSWVNQDLRQLNRRRVLTGDGSWSFLASNLLGRQDSHAFKVGGTHERASSSDEWLRNGGFTYFDDSSRCSSFAAYRADPTCGRYFVERGWGEYDAHPEYEGFALYAQDSLRVGRVTVNAGVRYGDYRGGWQSGHGDPGVFEVSYVDPRLGFVWDVRGTARTALRVHWGRYHDKIYTYLFDREASGEAALPDQDCFWNPATQAYDRCAPAVARWARIGSAGLAYVDETLLGFEQEIGASWTLGVDLLDRRFRDVMAMVNANSDYVQLTAPNPVSGGALPVWDLRSAQDWVLTSDAGGYRDFRSATLRLDKRRSRGWSGRASLVWSDFEGNVFANNGYAREFLDRNGLTYADGRTTSCCSEWEGKVSAEVDLPWNLEAGGFLSWSSGWYWTPYGRIAGLSYNALTGRDIFLEPRGSEKLPSRQLLDLRLAWTAALGRRIELTLSVDVFNVLNEDTALAVQNRWGLYRIATGSWLSRTDFGTPTQIEDPRRIVAGIRLEL